MLVDNSESQMHMIILGRSLIFKIVDLIDHIIQEKKEFKAWKLFPPEQYQY